MKREVFLGIDGGSSKTAGVIIDDSGKVLAEYMGQRSAVIGKPSMKSRKVLSHLVENLCQKFKIDKNDINYLGIGLNGIDFKDEFEMQLEEISNSINIPISKIKLVNDAIVALWGASNGERSIILQFGSGFTSAFRKNHGDEKLFDSLNVGNIFDLRSMTIIAVARMIDGRRESTKLKEEVLKYFEISENDYPEYVFRGKIPKEKSLSIASLVFKLWLEKDSAAGELIDSLIDDIIITTKAIAILLGKEKIDLCIGGGVLKPAPEKFWLYLRQKLDKEFPNIKFQRPVLPPEYGSAIMAAHSYGYDPVLLYDKLLKKYTELKKETR